jgi:hypothetical protein
MLKVVCRFMSIFHHHIILRMMVGSMNRFVVVPLSTAKVCAFVPQFFSLGEIDEFVCFARTFGDDGCADVDTWHVSW